MTTIFFFFFAQLVVVTHWMDASFVYGSTDEMARRLREFVGGRLLTEFRYGRPWPPAAQNKSATCDTQREEEPCYEFGKSIYLCSLVSFHS